MDLNKIQTHELLFKLTKKQCRHPSCEKDHEEAADSPRPIQWRLGRSPPSWSRLMIRDGIQACSSNNNNNRKGTTNRRRLDSKKVGANSNLESNESKLINTSSSAMQDLANLCLLWHPVFWELSERTNIIPSLLICSTTMTTTNDHDNARHNRNPINEHSNHHLEHKRSENISKIHDTHFITSASHKDDDGYKYRFFLLFLSSWSSGCQLQLSPFPRSQLLESLIDQS